METSTLPENGACIRNNSDLQVVYLRKGPTELARYHNFQLEHFMSSTLDYMFIYNFPS